MARTFSAKQTQRQAARNPVTYCDYCGHPWPMSHLRRDRSGKLYCRQEGNGKDVVTLADEEVAFAQLVESRSYEPPTKGFPWARLDTDAEESIRNFNSTSSPDVRAGTANVPSLYGATNGFDFSTVGDAGDTAPASISRTYGSVEAITQADETKRPTIAAWPASRGERGLTGLQFSQSSHMYYNIDCSSGTAWETALSGNKTQIFAAVAYPTVSSSYINEWFGLVNTSSQYNVGAGFWADTDSELMADFDGRAREGAAYVRGINASVNIALVAESPTIASQTVGIVEIRFSNSSGSGQWSVSDHSGRLDATTTTGVLADKGCLGSSFAFDGTTPDSTFRGSLLLGELVICPSPTMFNTKMILNYLKLKWGVIQ